MTRARRLSKADKCFEKAIVAIEKHNVSRRRAASIARQPLSTFQYRWNHKDDPPRSRSYINNSEEQIIVDLIKRYSSQGFPLNREDIKDAVQVVVSSLPQNRQEKLPFVGNRPGKKFLPNFLTRHQDEISFRRSNKEQEIRWRACNAETLTTHFLPIKKIIHDNNIDSFRIANLDETGISPNKDCLKSDKRKTFVTRSSFAVQWSPEFRNIERITMMPIVFASGCLGRPLFVVKGKSLKFRVTRNGDEECIETIADCPPNGSLITTREHIAGVESSSFMDWVKLFVNDNVERTRNGRKMLLIMDGYRSHMTFRVLDMFDRAGIIAYALPAHTSGVTQPLDVGVFGPFKMHLRNLIEGLSSPEYSNIYDAFDFLKLVTKAYTMAFTRSNIEKAFAKSGVHPLYCRPLLHVSRPISYEEPSTIISVEDISKMIDKKQKLQRDGIGLQPVVLRHGYVDTAVGLCLTSEEALQKAKEKNILYSSRRAVQAKRDAVKAEREAIVYANTMKERSRTQKRALALRVISYGVPDIAPRPMAVRRQVAKRIESQRNAEARAKMVQEQLGIATLQFR